MWSFSFYSDRLFKLDKINDKVKKEILYISSFSAKGIMLWILQFVIERYSRICEGKEDILQDRIEISHTTARNILREHGTEWRQSKTDLWSSNTSRHQEYDLKKSMWRGEELRSM
jgi:hypothetical protein